MRTIRAGGVACGVLAAAYGGWLLGRQDARATLVWLVGGVVLHDGVFSVLVLAVALVAVRVVRRDRLGPWVVGAVILVPVTLAGVPELGRFGARADNPTLLDRPYWLGWAVLVTLVVAGVVIGAVTTRPRRSVRGGDDGTGAGGR